MPETLREALEVEIRDVTAQPYLGKHLRAPMAAAGEMVQKAFADLYQRLQEVGCTPTAPPFLVADYPKDGILAMELGAPCATPPPAGNGFEPGTLSAGRVAVAVHRGSYDAIGPLYGRLSEWIATHGLTMAGPPREVYLTRPGEDPVTELVWPIG